MGYSKFKSVHIGTNVSIGNNNVISKSNIGSGSIIDANERLVILKGKHIPFHPEMTGNDIIQIDNHIIIDGFKLVHDKWVRLEEASKARRTTAPAQLSKRSLTIWQRLMNWLQGG